MTICRHDKNGEIYLAFRIYGKHKDGLAYFAFRHYNYYQQYALALEALRELRDVEEHYPLPPLSTTLTRLGLKKKQRIEYDFVEA